MSKVGTLEVAMALQTERDSRTRDLRLRVKNQN